jgi:hypothetical protein
MPVTLVLWRLRQEDREFKIREDSKTFSRPAKAKSETLSK